MIGFVVGGMVVVALVWAFAISRQKAADHELEMEMQAAIAEARQSLSTDDFAALRQQARELEDIGRSRVRAGQMSHREAMRNTKRLFIQSAHTSIEVHRMFNGEGQKSAAIGE